MPGKKIVYITLFFCLVKLGLHLMADANSGFQGDELLHIETGNHPDVGYMEFPPMIGWLAFVQNQFQSQSVGVHHLFSHLASLLIFVLMALCTVALGGRARAVFFVLLCMLAAPAFGRGHQLFQPVVFSQLFWLLSFYHLVRFSSSLDRKYLLYLAISLGFGFLTKYDILFFIGGLSGLFFFERSRKVLMQTHSLLCLLLFALLILPNLLWQFRHGFPVLDMFSRLYETQLNELTVPGVLGNLFLALNPFTSVLWIGGAIFMFRGKSKSTWRPVAVCTLLSLLLLAVSKSKFYYFFPAIFPLLMFGSIWFEQRILALRKWAIYPAAALLLISGMLMLPFSLAILPLNSYLNYAGIEEQEGRLPVDFEEYYSPLKWEKTLAGLREVYDSLPQHEKRDAVIWGKHYSQAGAVNLFGKDQGLPEAISYHGSFYLWAPEKGELPGTLIALLRKDTGRDFLEPFFDSVLPVKRIYNVYAEEEDEVWQTIYLCKGPKVDYEDLKREFRSRVFE